MLAISHVHKKITHDGLRAIDHLDVCLLITSRTSLSSLKQIQSIAQAVSRDTYVLLLMLKISVVAVGPAVIMAAPVPVPLESSLV